MVSVSYSGRLGPTVTLSQSDSGEYTCVFSGVDELVGFRSVNASDALLGVSRDVLVKPAVVNAVKLSFATPVISSQYTGADLDGPMMLDGVLIEPRRLTITTTYSAGTYNTTNPVLIGGLSIYLTKLDGGETVESETLTPSGIPLVIIVPFQNDSNGFIEIGCAQRAEFKPTDIYPVTVTKTTSAADVVAIAGRIFTELVRDVSVSEGLVFGPEQLLAVQHNVSHCSDVVLRRFES